MKHVQAQTPEPMPTRSANPPALSISVPPPRSQRAMSYVLGTLLVGSLALTLAGVVAYLLQAI